MPNGHDDIVGIRIIRDPETLIGKGIGYMLLKDRDAVLKALSLHGVSGFLIVELLDDSRKCRTVHFRLYDCMIGKISQAF